MEILLSITCLSLILAMSVPAYRMLQIRNDLDIAAITLAQSLRRAQILSQTGNGDTTWGVYVGNGGILIYKGASYATRDSVYDEMSDLPSTITGSGVTEVNFSKLYGIPNQTGTFILTGVDNETRNVTLNQKGMVEY